MNCLFSTFIEGVTTRRKETEQDERIQFYSQKRREYVEGIVLGVYSEDYGAKIVQYMNEGKRELAIVEKKIAHNIAQFPIVTDVATIERLVFVSQNKNGMAVACRKGASHLNVLLLNERGECVQCIGRRYRLMNKFVKGQTNRRWIKQEKSLRLK